MRKGLLALVGSMVFAASLSVSHADCNTQTLLFDLTGPTCLSGSLLTPCQCSEGMEWEPVPEATYYLIQRKQLPSGPTVIAGDTRWANRRSYTDEDGNVVPANLITYWYFAWDCLAGGCFFPQLGMSYEYSVKACKPNPQGGADLCSVAWSTPVSYLASPYYCYTNGALVPCY